MTFFFLFCAHSAFFFVFRRGCARSFRVTWQELLSRRPESSALHSAASTICLRVQDGHCSIASALSTESSFTRLGFQAQPSECSRAWPHLISPPFWKIKSNKINSSHCRVRAFCQEAFGTHLSLRHSSRLAAAKPCFISFLESVDQVASIVRHNFSALNARARHLNSYKEQDFCPANSKSAVLSFCKTFDQTLNTKPSRNALPVSLFFVFLVAVSLFCVPTECII